MYDRNNETKDWNELYAQQNNSDEDTQPLRTPEEPVTNDYTQTPEEPERTPTWDDLSEPPQYKTPDDATYHYSFVNSRPDPWDQAAPKKKEKEKKGLTAGKVIAIALCCSLLGGIVGAGGMAIGGKMFAKNAAQPTETVGVYEGERTPKVLDINSIDTSKLMTAAEVYAANVNSTVGITTQITTNYFGYQTTSAASGSGFVFSENGYILTNYHVIENANEIKVTMYDNTSYDAELVGYDSANDIAVLKIDAEKLTPVIVGDSDVLNVGDSVVAIGNPLGELTFSLTSGSVSALDRTVTFSGAQTMKLIQTDCAINSGNSGGALFNLYGEVIGITNAKYSGSTGSGATIDNIGFAIPINSVKEIVKSIIEKGFVSKPYIGVTVGSVSEEAQGYGLPAGATIKGIVEDSPAEEAGLEINDIITEADETEIKSQDDLVAFVAGKEIGDTITLHVYRQGEYQDISLTIGEQRQTLEDNLAAQQQQQEQQQQQQQEQQIPGFSFPFGFDFGW